MRARWLSRRALTLHVALIIFVPGCAIAAWWQITRAQDGNGLSYLYSVEWPIFALLAIYFWWLLIHTNYDEVGLKGTRQKAAAGNAVPSVPIPEREAAPALTAVDAAEDPELAAYNARLADLAASGAKTWRRPETHVARLPK